MRTAIVSGCWVAIVLSGSARADDATVTEAEARRVAVAFEEALQSGEAASAAVLMDWDGIVARATGGFGRNAELEAAREEFAVKFLESIRSSGGLTSQLTEAVQQGGSYRLLRMREENGQPRALFRLVIPDGGGVNYHSLEFSRGADGRGRVRIADVFIGTAGERFSQSLRRTFVPQAAAIVGAVGLSESDRRMLDQGEVLRSAGELLAAGDPAAALAVIEAVPEGVELDQPLRLVALAAAEQVGVEEYTRVVGDLRMGEGSIELVVIDGFSRLGEYGAALDSIDRLETVIWGDPYLNVLRAGILYQAGRPEEAAAAARKAIADDPTLEDAYWQLTTISLDQSNFAVTVEMLTLLEQRLNVAIADLTEIPEYAAFVQSPEYAAWMRSRGR